MKITLLHPSRGRAVKANNTFNHWMRLKSNNPDIEIEHVLSIDKDDKHLNLYNVLFKTSKIMVANNKSLVEATNRGAAVATGDVILYMSDDFYCPEHWDQHIYRIFAEKTDVPYIIKVHDCLQKPDCDIITIPIMNRALYTRLGYFWHPDYKSMFVDQDLYYTCKNNGWLDYKLDLEFPHHHYCNGKSLKDETYMRSSQNWNSGKATYNIRKSANFPL